jgi:hypothetical protein
MRPTDFCHLNDLRVPVPRVFPAHYATFAAWTPHGVLGSVRITGGPSVSRHPRTLQRIAAGHALPYCLVAAPHCLSTECVSSERGHFTPTAPATDRASDTSVASSSSVGRRSAFASPSALALASRIAFPREEAAKVAVTTFS